MHIPFCVVYWNGQMIICTNQSFNQPGKCNYTYISLHCVCMYKLTSLQQLLQSYAGMPVGVRYTLHETSHRGCVPPRTVYYE